MRFGTRCPLIGWNINRQSINEVLAEYIPTCWMYSSPWLKWFITASHDNKFVSPKNEEHLAALFFLSHWILWNSVAGKDGRYFGIIGFFERCSNSMTRHFFLLGALRLKMKMKLFDPRKWMETAVVLGVSLRLQVKRREKSLAPWRSWA